MCIWILNHQPGEIVHQPIIQLFGFDSIYHETLVVNQNYQWPIVQGLFKIYIPLEPGENTIHLSTLVSQLSLTIVFSPMQSNKITLRLIHLSFSDQIESDLEYRCRQFTFLTKLVRSTFDELLWKQTGYQRSGLFAIERKFHHVAMSKTDFEDKTTDQEIFKEIYRQINATELAQDSSMKLIINSTISPSLTFAYTFKNVIVFNLPKQLRDLPTSFDEFYEDLKTTKVESLFYSIGAYLHELGHLFGLDHGNVDCQTIMSSSKGYIESGKDFFCVSPHFYSMLFHRRCSCYKEPMSNMSCSYSNGVLQKHSTHLNSTCKSDSHCQLTFRFDHRKDKNKPNQCTCNGAFQFEVDHCRRLMEQFSAE